ncbi:hypothetical protein TNCV_3801311 [Trichonephila clavipes]|nr:hypothetical protein TNCV_3801311 [Trichonephila clavipes]
MNWMECLGLSASNLLSVKKSLKNARKVGGVILANPSSLYFPSQRHVESSLAHWPGNPRPLVERVTLNDPRSLDDPENFSNPEIKISPLRSGAPMEISTSLVQYPPGFFCSSMRLEVLEALCVFTLPSLEAVNCRFPPRQYTPGGYRGIYTAFPWCMFFSTKCVAYDPLCMHVGGYPQRYD